MDTSEITKTTNSWKYGTVFGNFQNGDRIRFAAAVMIPANKRAYFYIGCDIFQGGSDRGDFWMSIGRCQYMAGRQQVTFLHSTWKGASVVNACPFPFYLGGLVFQLMAQSLAGLENPAWATHPYGLLAGPSGHVVLLYAI